MTPTPNTKRRVAVLLETSTGWGRGIIAGIYSHARQHPAWRIFVEARGRGDPVELPRNWKGDGVIARVGDLSTAAYLRAQAIPVVNVSALHLPGPQFPRVATDVEAVGQMAVRYFLERGYRHFGYLSLLGLECVIRQRRAFTDAARAAGCDCGELGVEVSLLTQSPDWDLRIEQLSAWLKALPKPVAVLTWNGGREVIDGCQQAGLAVPEDVALLSGSEDELLCQVSDIPISSVRQPVEQIGLKAAAVLDALIDGKRPRKKPIWIAPLEVITRQSTNTLALSDRSVAAALTFIRENASKAIRVSDVAAQVGVSRRVLERRFTEHLHRSPAEYIRRSHLDCAKLLLAQTDQPISMVAEASGFPSQQYLTQILRRDSGMSPLKYRRYARAGFR